MVDNQTFVDELKRLVNAFGHRLNGDMIAEYYSSSLKYLSEQQVKDLVDRAKEEYDKFPTLKQLKMLAGEMGFYNDARRITANVIIQCLCGASAAVERTKINARQGKVYCPNNFYDHLTVKGKKLCERYYMASMLAECKEYDGVIYMKENLDLLRKFETEGLLVFETGEVGKNK